MGGYAHRTHGAEAVADELMLKVLALRHGGRLGALVTADLLWLRREAADALKAALACRYGMDPELVLIACSHTHSGPQTASDTPSIGRADAAYMRHLFAEALDATGRALAALRPVAGIRTASGRASLGVNRRVVLDGRARMLPNAEGPRDDEVLAAVLDGGADARPLAVLFQYTCHPTCLGTYDLSADWPGAAMRRVEADLGAPCLFLQGCCGDVRPNVTGPDGRFRSATVAETHAAGDAVGAEVVRLVRGGGGDAGRPLLAGRTLEVGLAYARVPSAEDLDALHRSAEPRLRALAEFLRSRPERLAPAAPFRLHRVDLAEGLVLAGMEGEVCVGYGFECKRLGGGRRVVPVGYADGCTAYVPTADMFPYGGYEVDEAYPYFGLPAPFEPSVDGRVRAALARLLA